MKIPDIIPVTDLRQNAAAIIKKLQGTTGPVVITQRGRSIAVLQSIESYEKTEHEHELLRILATGEKEVTMGKGHSLASVMNDADDLLKDDTS